MTLDFESYRLGGVLGQRPKKLHASDPQDFVLLSSFCTLSRMGFGLARSPLALEILLLLDVSNPF